MLSFGQWNAFENIIWINTLNPDDGYIRQWTRSSLFQLWLILFTVPGYYLNKYLFITDLSVGPIVSQWSAKLYNNYVMKNVFENVVWNSSSILCCDNFPKGLIS